MVPLLLAPAAVLQAVQNHVVGQGVVARVDVKGDVGTAPGSALEVHVEPGGAQKQG